MFFFGFISAQEEIVHSVYFEFDKYSFDDKQAKEVVDFINEFKLNILNENYKIENNDFKQKLFQTYQDYYRKLNA